MADQLYLSYRVRGFNSGNMLLHYEKMLAVFPYSRLSQAPALLRVNAIATSEPALIERIFEPPLDVEEMLSAANVATAPDCSVEIEVYWDLWQFVEEWKLTPSRVTLACFGPDFEELEGDHLRVAFGIDTHYLPQTGLPMLSLCLNQILKACFTLFRRQTMSWQ
ncbi:MAG: hypothetical protein WKF37_07250 [Bryobacteraceae bacterium]